MDTVFLKIAFFTCSALALASCGRDNRLCQDTVSDADIEVLLDASIECGMQASTKADLIGVVKGTTFPTSTEKVFAITAVRDDELPTDFTPSSRINNDWANTNALGVVTFAKPKYYPEEGKLYFYSYSPMAHCEYIDGSTDSHTLVHYTMTSNEDIMWAKYDEGIIKYATVEEQKHPKLIFRHQLTQLQLQLIQGNNFPSSPKVDSLSITNVPKECTLDIIDGNITWGENDTIVVKNSNMAVRPYSSSMTTYPIMVKPDIEYVHLSFSIRGIDYETDIVLNPSNNEGKAGYATLVKLTFSGLKLTFTTELTDWDYVGYAKGDI